MVNRTEKEIEQAVLASRITLTLTVFEINQFLSIIGRYPFDEVVSLIKRIQDEAQPQVNAAIAQIKAEDEANTLPA